MKYLFYVFILTQLLFSNTEFSTQEESVFERPLPETTQEMPIKQADESFKLNKNKEIEPKEAIEENISNDNETLLLPPLQESSNPESNENLVNNEEENIEQNVEVSTPEIIVQTEEQLFGENENQQNEIQINYFEEVFPIEANNEKNIYLNYINYPKNIYKNQRFEIDIKALVTTKEFDRIETRFIHSENMTVLNPTNEWKEEENNVFVNKYYFKSFDPSFIMPTFQLVMYYNNEITEVAYLQPEEVNFSEIGLDDEKFSSIIAQSLKVNAYKSKQYNNNELITILEIEGYKSNLEDFHLKNIEEQGFSTITDEYPNQTMLYYVVLPIHHKKIEFTYYNIEKKRFEKVNVPVILENELVSTQTDLNPNNSNLLLYKKVALSIVALVLLILFIWKRKFIYMLALIAVLVVLILYFLPNRQAYIKADATIYILPTKNSTIFYKTQKMRVVEVAMKKESFVKIIMNINNKKIIGWIKEENLVEN